MDANDPLVPDPSAEGLLSVDDIDSGGKDVTGDERVYEDMSPANRVASVFPPGCCS